jgi:RimJ/RimL family protein N-acetyltransferase
MISYNFGVKLDTLKQANLEIYRKARNNREIWQWCRQYDLISERDQEAWFKRQNEDQKIRMYEIILDNGVSADDKLVGVCGLTDIDHVNQRAEFSIYILPEYHKQKFGTVAMKTLLAHGFLNLNLNCIWGETFDGNPACKMFEALGLVNEGTRRELYFRDGKFIAAHMYSMLRSECSWLS